MPASLAVLHSANKLLPHGLSCMCTSQRATCTAILAFLSAICAQIAAGLGAQYKARLAFLNVKVNTFPHWKCLIADISLVKTCRRGGRAGASVRRSGLLHRCGRVGAVHPPGSRKSTHPPTCTQPTPPPPRTATPPLHSTVPHEHQLTCTGLAGIGCSRW